MFRKIISWILRFFKFETYENDQVARKKWRGIPGVNGEGYCGGRAEKPGRNPGKEDFLKMISDRIYRIRNGFGGGFGPGTRRNLSNRFYIVGRHGEWIRVQG